VIYVLFFTALLSNNNTVSIS